LVLLHPNREWTVTEVAHRLGIAVTMAQNEVARLTQLTLVTFGPQTVTADE
jgi:predicted transcriptional regulator